MRSILLKELGVRKRIGDWLKKEKEVVNGQENIVDS